MTPDPTELARVLAALDELAPSMTVGKDCAEAARLLRDMAADFAVYADHREDCFKLACRGASCSCDFDFMRAKWRLEPESGQSGK